MAGALRDSIRSWRRTPGVAAIAVVSLSLSIGAATTLFSIADQLLLGALPVDRPTDLYLLSDEEQAARGRHLWVRTALWREIQARPALYESAFAVASSTANLAPAGEADRADVIWASGDTFQALRLRLHRGRLLGPGDDRPGGGPDGLVTVLSHRFWQRRFASREDVVGSRLSINGRSVLIVGVVEPSFGGFEVGASFDLVVPLAAQSLVPDGSGDYYAVTMRLPQGRTPEDVSAVLRAGQAAIRAATLPDFLRTQDRDGYLRSPLTLISGASGGSSPARYFGRPVTLALGLALVVLLAACGNVAALLVAHAEGRAPELAVHTAMGASAFATGRRLVLDSVVIAGASAVIGLAFAYAAVPLALAEMSAIGFDVVLSRAINWRGAGTALLLALTTAVICGLAPAVRAGRFDPVATLNSSGVRHGRSTAWLRGFVGLQIAFSMVVIVAGALLMRSHQNLLLSGSSVNAPGLLVVDLDLAPAPDVDQFTRDIERLRETVAEMPGVLYAASTMTAPLQLFVTTTVVEPPRFATLAEADRIVQFNWVSPSYFQAFGTRVLAGRDFNAADAMGAPRVAIVNHAYARKFLGGELALPGLVVHPRDDGTREALTIVGIVDDVSYKTLGEPAEPGLFVPAAQRPGLVDDVTRASLVIRPDGAASTVMERLPGVLSAAAPGLRFSTTPFSTYVRRETARLRILAIIAALFTTLAALLAVAGIFGISAYQVASERKDLGVRLAIGAQRWQVGRLVAARSFAVVLAGMSAGSVAALWTSELLEREPTGGST